MTQEIPSTARLVEGWTHEPGRHCGSTALSDLVRQRGWPFSEARCFGLGSGLGSFYMSLEGNSPSRLFFPRSASLERAFFERCGVAFRWIEDPDPDHARADLERHVAADRPVLLRCDLSRLPYFGARTPFSGHTIVVWGHDPAAGVVLVSDTGLEGLQTITWEALDHARSSPMPPIPLTRDHFPVPELGPPPDPAEVVPAALRRQAEILLHEGMFTQGVGALREMAADLRGPFAEAPDWTWCARFAYQTIAVRGTGGAGFRRIHAEFLREVEADLPALAAEGLADEMAGIADLWETVATGLEEASETEDPARLKAVADDVDRLADREEAVARRMERVGS